MAKCRLHNIEHGENFPCEQYEEHRKLMHRLNSGVDRADHLNLRDGIMFDVDGIPSGVGEDTKIPLGPLGPVGEHDLPDDFNEVPDVNDDALAEWGQHKERQTPPGSMQRDL